MSKPLGNTLKTSSSATGWRKLCTVGGTAALIAGILFRRNIAVEISIFSNSTSPVTVNDWFKLLQENRFLGLTYLHGFDLVNYALVGLMFLALYAVLKEGHISSMTVAATFALLGIAVYFATNTAFSMLSLSNQFAATTSEVQRSQLLAAGQAMLATGRFSSHGAHPGSGGLMSLLLMATAGMTASVAMLRSKVFNRTVSIVGIIAGALDFAYCAVYIFLPTVDGELLAVSFIPTAGLFLMVWHIMTGWKLCKLGRQVGNIRRGL